MKRSSESTSPGTSVLQSTVTKLCFLRRWEQAAALLCPPAQGSILPSLRHHQRLTQNCPQITSTIPLLSPRAPFPGPHGTFVPEKTICPTAWNSSDCPDALSCRHGLSEGWGGRSWRTSLQLSMEDCSYKGLEAILLGEVLASCSHFQNPYSFVLLIMRHNHRVMLLHCSEAGLLQQTRGSGSRPAALDHSFPDHWCLALALILSRNLLL